MEENQTNEKPSLEPVKEGELAMKEEKKLIGEEKDLQNTPETKEENPNQTSETKESEPTKETETNKEIGEKITKETDYKSLFDEVTTTNETNKEANTFSSTKEEVKTTPSNSFWGNFWGGDSKKSSPVIETEKMVNSFTSFMGSVGISFSGVKQVMEEGVKQLEQYTDKGFQQMEEFANKGSSSFNTFSNQVFEILAPTNQEEDPQQAPFEQTKEESNTNNKNNNNNNNNISLLINKPNEGTFQYYFEEESGHLVIEWFREKEILNLKECEQILRNFSSVSQKVKINDEIKLLQELFNEEETEEVSSLNEEMINKSCIKIKQFETLFEEGKKLIIEQQNLEQLKKMIIKQTSCLCSFSLNQLKMLAVYSSSLEKQENEGESWNSIEDLAFFVFSVISFFENHLFQLSIQSFKTHSLFTNNDNHLQEITECFDHSVNLLIETKTKLFSFLKLKLLQFNST